MSCITRETEHVEQHSDAGCSQLLRAVVPILFAHSPLSSIQTPHFRPASAKVHAAPVTCRIFAGVEE